MFVKVRPLKSSIKQGVKSTVVDMEACCFQSFLVFLWLVAGGCFLNSFFFGFGGAFLGIFGGGRGLERGVENRGFGVGGGGTPG